MQYRNKGIICTIFDRKHGSVMVLLELSCLFCVLRNWK